MCHRSCPYLYGGTGAKKAAAKRGDLIKVETQGATGIENELNERDCQIGEVVIFAVDTKVRNEERFNGKEILKVPVAAPIKNAEKVIEDALKLIDQ